MAYLKKTFTMILKLESANNRMNSFVYKEIKQNIIIIIKISTTHLHKINHNIIYIIFIGKMQFL